MPLPKKIHPSSTPTPSPADREVTIDKPYFLTESHKAVLVGNHRVTFQDVISDTLREPFNWTCFAHAARERFGMGVFVRFVEEYRGLFREVGGGKGENGGEKVIQVVLGWCERHLRKDSKEMLRLGAEMREQALVLVDSMKESQHIGPSPLLELVKIAFEPIYYHVLGILFYECFQPWAIDTAIELDVQLSKQVTLWWKKPLKQFFTWPNPVDKAEIRINAGISSSMSLMLILMDIFMSMYTGAFVMLYSHIARPLSGPRICPFSWITLYALRPALAEKIRCVEYEFVPAPPIRFSETCRGLLIFIAIILRIFNFSLTFWIMMGINGVWAGLIAYPGLDMGVLLFNVGIRLGLVPRETADLCAVKYVNTDIRCPASFAKKKIRGLDV